MLGACAAPPEAPAWEAREAAVRARRAEALLETGDPAAAGAEARQAAELARRGGDAGTAARAELVLGALDDDVARVSRALDVLRDRDDLDGTVLGHRTLARLASARGDLATARASIEAACALVTAVPDHARRGRLEAAARADLAVIERAAGHPSAAAAATRRAWLALTLVPPDELGDLRLRVCRDMAALHEAAGDLEQALEFHSRIARLAQRLDRPRVEVGAVRRQAETLARLGRARDGADHLYRAFSRARRFGDPHLLAAIAAEGLAGLDAIGETDSPRRDEYRAALP